jgi:quinol monooxygenase YgiN
MIVFAATLTTKPGKEQELEDALVQLASKVQHEEGALVYTILRVSNDPRRITVFEKYRDQKALDNHNSTSDIKIFRAKLDALLDEEIQVIQYEEIFVLNR